MVDPSAGFGELPLEIMVEMISALCSKCELQGDDPSNWNWSVPLSDTETVRSRRCVICMLGRGHAEHLRIPNHTCCTRAQTLIYIRWAANVLTLHRTRSCSRKVAAQ
eukprot:8285069-Pyramimonas_sp.AAC.1